MNGRCLKVTALPRTENIMMHFVGAENNTGAEDKVTIERVKQGQTVRLYKSLDAKDVLAEKTAEEDGTISFEQLDFGPEAEESIIRSKTKDERESLKYSTAYLTRKGNGSHSSNQ